MDISTSPSIPFPLAEAGTRILGADGVLADHLPGYEARDAQVAMTNLIGQALSEKKQALIEAGTGCIYGDAEIIVNRGGNARRFRLSDLVDKFNGGTGRTGNRGGRFRWDTSIQTHIQREGKDGTIRLAVLKHAWCSGIKKTFILTTSTGRAVRATSEHPFLTDRGWIKLGDLHIGDQVRCIAGQKTTGSNPKPTYRAIYRMHNHPFSCRRKNGSASVERHRLTAEASLNGLTYQQFVSQIHSGDTSELKFVNPRELEVHHRDGDHSNDSPDNLEVLRIRDHRLRHAEEGYKNVLYKTAFEEVVSIKYYGEEVTYDLEVADDPHNFLANGFVVHNSGKSFAYLIPAILSGQKVIVSTDTIALQGQLIQKDLPFLAEILKPILGREISFAIAKGRGNYFCERNTRSLVEEGLLLENWDRDPNHLVASSALSAFDKGEWDGDKANLKLPIPDYRWGIVAGEESCTGKSCEYAHRCPYMLARQEYEEADVVVTNHAMYLLHHYVYENTSGTVGILPEHSVWIADEAHTLPDRVCDVFGITLKHTAPASVLRGTVKAAKRLGISLEDVNQELIRTHADSFFGTFYGAAKQEQRLDAFPEEILDLANHGMGLLISELKPLRLALNWGISDTVRDGDSEKGRAIQRLYDRVDKLIGNLRKVMLSEPEPPQTILDEEGNEVELAPREDPNDWVSYAEISGFGQAGPKNTTLHRKPIETGPILRRILERLNSTIMTSATLATGSGQGAWKLAANELGVKLKDALTLIAPAPFDYSVQTRGYVPATMPEGRDPGYHQIMAMEINDIIERTRGRAFVLFTSYRDMGKVYDLVQARTSLELMMQGDCPKDALLENFLKTPNAVLFGTKTFWTGIDIPGDRLSCVIITKLPFPNHQHPLVEARCRRIETRGGKSFFEFMIPRCIRDMQQGFGRLIRTKTDRGLLVVLDNRLRAARYGGQIANALPNFDVAEDLDSLDGFLRTL